MEVPIIISGLSAFVGAIVYKGGASLSIKYAEKIKRRMEKKRLTKELQQSIQNLNFIEFQNTNYKLKVYDNNYNKELYVKMKKQYRYSDDEVLDENKYLKRFDISYTRFDSYKPYLQQIIKDEIERSIKTNKFFQITRSRSNLRLEIEEGDIKDNLEIEI